MNLAIFDLDNTLLAGDSDYLWGRFLCARGIVDTALYEAANQRFYEDYKQGTLDIDAFLRFSLAPLALHSMEQLAAWHDEFMHEFIEPIILPKGLELIATHRARGDHPLIITATNAFVTEPIARRLGVTDILATRPEMQDGRYTGRYLGTPTFQQGKIKALHDWTQAQAKPFEKTWFYSDSRNDLPLLEQVHHPVAVDADPTLAAEAERRGWPQISLR
ncbi:MAG TPA: HAD family hydrolase [bacterium]|nr:HAD family hydrolase [bacterium]